MAAEGELGVAAAHERGQLFVDDLHHLLPGREALQDLRPQSALLHVRDELAHDLEVDVGLEQRETDLAHGLVDIGLAQLAVAAQLAERALQPIGE